MQESSSDDLQYDKGCPTGPCLRDPGETAPRGDKVDLRAAIFLPCKLPPTFLQPFPFSDDLPLLDDSLLISSYTSGIVLEKVAEYFCYNHKNRNREDVPDMEIPPELCLELLMAADYLDSEFKDDVAYSLSPANV